MCSLSYRLNRPACFSVALLILESEAAGILPRSSWADLSQRLMLGKHLNIQ